MNRCLLDMDGVLSDFVGGACRLHKVPNPYDNPVNHGKPRIEELVGIPAVDFFGPMDEAFWAGLDPTPECFKIVAEVEKVFGRNNVCILTSPVRTHGCFEGKLAWIRKHLPQFGRRFLVGPSKEFAAGPHSWLVDDSDANVINFANWGGNAVQVPQPWNSIHKYSSSVMAWLRRDLPERGNIL